MLVKHAKRAAGNHVSILLIKINWHFTANRHINSVLKSLILLIEQVTKSMGVIRECITNCNAFVVVGLQNTEPDAFHFGSTNLSVTVLNTTVGEHLKI